MKPFDLRHARSAWRAALLGAALSVGAAQAGCSAAATATDTAAAAETALSTTHDTTDAPELAGMLAHLASGPRDEGVEAWRCDPEPEITYMEVCGQQLPATLHFAWTSCADNRGPGADHQPCGPDGGMGAPPPPLPDGGEPGGFRHRGPDGAGRASSGTVDIVNTITADSCDPGAALTFAEKVTFAIDRTDPRGTRRIEGTTDSTSSHALDATSFTKTTQLDVKHTDTPSGGSAETTELSGQLAVAFDSTTGEPVRTIDGTLARKEADGTTDNVTLSQIVRAPPRTCRAPTSGTLTYAGGDGSSHTLVFGPTCGAATLDGASITLDDHRGPGGPGGPGDDHGGSGGMGLPGLPFNPPQP